MDWLNFYASLIVFLSVFSSVSSIKCYQCTSSDDLECGEIFDAEHTKLEPQSCDHIHDAQYCLKTTGISEGKIQTIRGCTSRRFEDYCSYVKRPGDAKSLRSCLFMCRSDGCNKSSESPPSTVFIYLSLILAAFMGDWLL